MATQAKKANPYNANKEWHNQKEKPFVSADGVFFEKPEVQDDKEEPQQSKKETKNKPDYKKRYDDLKTHYDSKLNEFKSREQELLEEAAQNRPSYVAPKSPEDLEKFREQYPDVYEVVETVAHMQSSERTKSLEEKLASLQERETELITRQATERLLQNHPDFEDIKNSDDFHGWAKEQPQSIQDWIYKNATDADLASRALDLFKKDFGIDLPKTKSSSKKPTKGSAADMVSTKTTSVDSSQEKVWSEREIAAMSMAEYDKYENAINDAWQEGRITK